MGAPLVGRNVVDIAVQVLGELPGVLQGDVPGDPLVFASQRDHIRVEGITRAIEPLDEFFDAAFVEELFGATAAGVGEDDSHARVQKGQLLQPAGEDVTGELRLGKDLRVGLEGGFRARTGRRAHLADRAGRLTPLVLLLPEMAIPAHLDLAPLRQKVDHRHADAMQATRGLVGALLEFAAELEHRHHAFQRRDLTVHLVGELPVNVGRDTAAVILDRHTAIDVDRHRHPLGIAGHALID